MTPAAFESTFPRYVAAERSKKKSEHSLKSYDLHLRRFRDYLSESNETEITPLTVIEWRNSLFESGLKQSSIHQYMATVSRFFDWAKRMGLNETNPVPEEEIPDLQNSKQEIPTKEEIYKLIQTKPYALASKMPFRNYTIVAFLCLTGLRSDELRELRLSDLNFAKGYVRVRCGKGGKERNVPFPARAQKLVREYLELGIRPAWCTDEDYLFGTGKETSDAPKSDEVWHKWDASTLGRMVKRYVKRMIGKDVHPHTLRHCAASLWDDAGVSMRDVQNALGHASITTTERIYVSILNKEKAAAKINAALENV